MVREWQVEARLGDGALGPVWLVRDSGGRRGVLRRYEPELAERFDLGSLDRLAALRGENLQQVLDYGAESDGSWFVVNAYVEGETLAQTLERGPLDAAQTRALGLALCRALGALHGQGLVHRDVKPSNIIIPAGASLGGAVLADYGLVGQQHEHARTGTGTVIGTIRYMAPEQVTGSGVTHQADLWALGVVLYEAVTGRFAFDGDNVFEVARATLQSAIDLEVVPAELREALRWALEKNPERRVPNAAALERALADERAAALPLPPPPATQAGPAPPWGMPAPPSQTAPSEPPSAAPFSHVPKTDAPTSSVTLAPAQTARLNPKSATPKLVLALALLALLVPGVWLVLVADGRGALTLVAALGSAALLTLALHALTRLRSRAGAERVQRRMARRPQLTRSLAWTIDDLADRYSKNPHARLLTQSMALVLSEYRGAAAASPDARLDVTLKALDAMLRLEARIAEVTAPWYQRYDKLVALIGAVGAGGATWFGLGQNVASATRAPQPLITGCPTTPIGMTARVRLEARDRQALSWSVDGRALLVGSSLTWPDDAGEARPGTYSIRAVAAAEGDRCVIEVRRPDG